MILRFIIVFGWPILLFVVPTVLGILATIYDR